MKTDKEKIDSPAPAIPAPWPGEPPYAPDPGTTEPVERPGETVTVPIVR